MVVFIKTEFEKVIMDGNPYRTNFDHYKCHICKHVFMPHHKPDLIITEVTEKNGVIKVFYCDKCYDENSIELKAEMTKESAKILETKNQ